MKKTITLTVNGDKLCCDVATDKTLLRFLREDLGLTGAKEGCGVGECGACTVVVDGYAVNSCMMLAVEADGCQVLTIEGEAQDGKLSDLQEAFIQYNGFQCGFCTPGMIMAARALLMRNPNPSREEIIEAMAGNLCRCTGYTTIIEAVEAVTGGGDHHG